jgi:hypothetical protein
LAKELCVSDNPVLNDNAALTQVLNDYYKTFSTLNLDAIYPYFHTPALIVGPAGVFAIANPEDLATVFGPAIADLRSRGTAAASLRRRASSS